MISDRRVLPFTDCCFSELGVSKFNSGEGVPERFVILCAKHLCAKQFSFPTAEQG